MNKDHVGNLFVCVCSSDTTVPKAGRFFTQYGNKETIVACKQLNIDKRLQQTNTFCGLCFIPLALNGVGKSTFKDAGVCTPCEQLGSQILEFLLSHETDQIVATDYSVNSQSFAYSLSLRSKGVRGTFVSAPGQNFFIFMQFSGKIGHP